MIESKEVIKSIKAIYAQFPITENLKIHMCRAASVGELIYDHLEQKGVDKDDAIAALLLHDLGNIVKFKFDPQSAKLLGKEIKRIDYWKKAKEETIAKYGSDNDYAVTHKMMVELGVNERVVYIVDNYWDKGTVDPSKDLALTMTAYGDARSGPFGIITLEERFIDLSIRYKGDWREAHFSKSKERAFGLEKYLISRTDLTPDDVNDSSVAPYLERRLHVLGFD